MRTLFFSAFVFNAAFAAAAPAAAPSPAVDETAVWSPTPGELVGLRDACAAKTGPDAGACLLAFMERAGATPAAIAFSRALGGTGYLRRLQDRGAVDSARVASPLKEGAPDRFLLVNGAPPRLDVSDRVLIAPLQGDPRVERLNPAGAVAAIQPGEPASAGAKPRPGGGERFLFVFPVKSCPDCPELASAFVAYDFDASSRFMGATLIGVRRPPVFSTTGEVTRGQAFSAPVGGGLTFRLEPFGEGWSIAVKDKDGKDYCGVVTPPFSGDNDLVLHGSQFKDGRLRPRRFKCLRTPEQYSQASADLGLILWGEGAPARKVRDARRLHAVLMDAARPGKLTIRSVKLSGGPEEEHPAIESMRFKIELFPAPGEKSGPAATEE